MVYLILGSWFTLDLIYRFRVSFFVCLLFIYFQILVNFYQLKNSRDKKYKYMFITETESIRIFIQTGRNISTDNPYICFTQKRSEISPENVNC